MVRFLTLAGLYFVVGLAAFFSSFLLRFDGVIPVEYQEHVVGMALLAAAVQAATLVGFGHAKALPTFFSLMDLRSMGLANGISGVLLFVLSILVEARIPRGVIVLDVILLTGGVALARTVLRFWGERRRSAAMEAKWGEGAVRPTAIVGAGESGAALLRELHKRPGLRMSPVAVFDDDPQKWDHLLHGVPIVGKPELLKEPRWRNQVRKVVIAIPSAPASRIGEIARLCAELGLSSDTMPAMDQLVEGRVKVSQLRPVQIEDLLRRVPIALDQAGIDGILRDQVVAVTGAGGSIGSELCRQILAHGPSTLLLIERSEVQLYPIEQELCARGGRNIVVPLVADISDPVRIRDIFHRHRPAVVFHAAAHKHVPMMESQPGEALRNNSMGTANVVRQAHEAGVGRFVLISTDKAINPTNAMGASKRLAEIFLQSFQAAHPGPTRFMAVRFGNVLGSSGSVVPTFQKQIAAGGPVTVTHPDVTRFFMTIPEAVGLVLQAGALGKGGEIFVLDMGDPIKIVDLAKQMIELSGYRPGEDIEIEYSGLRPGEKLYEELSHHREQLTETGHPKIFRFVAEPPTLEAVEGFLGRLEPRLFSSDPGDLKRSIQEMVPEYRPYVH
jgi:FlaA1/EpsC-like NDP-sugar epimerase